MNKLTLSTGHVPLTQNLIYRPLSNRLIRNADKCASRVMHMAHKYIFHVDHR